MRLKHITLAASALLLSTAAASAATVTNDLNMRTGPSTGYRVIDTIPQGAYVRVLNCRGSWCRVTFRGRVGYASANYIAGEGAYAASPRVYAPPPPVFRFGFGWGGPRWHDRNYRHYRRDRHDGWRGGHRGRRPIGD